VSIAAVTVLVSEFGVGMQIHVALFILMVSLTVHLVAHPFMVRKLFFLILAAWAAGRELEVHILGTKFSTRG
jgi:hypothetical protein